jgi:preprotein translocase subunit SecY
MHFVISHILRLKIAIFMLLTFIFIVFFNFFSIFLWWSPVTTTAQTESSLGVTGYRRGVQRVENFCDSTFF